MMRYRRKLVHLGFACSFILLASYALTYLTVNYTYLRYYQNEQLYLNAGTTQYSEKSINELTTSSSLSIELRVIKGSIISVDTKLISGDIDVDIILLVHVNRTSESVTGYSITQGSSSERISNECKIEDVPLATIIFTRYPFAQLLLIPRTGSGIIELNYTILHPAQEFFYICLLSIIIGLSFFIKDLLSIIKQLL